MKRLRWPGLGLCVLIPGPALSAQDAPAVRLPAPTGSHAVGRVTLQWTDASRGDVLATDATARRELVVDVWYPAADGSTGRSADYVPDFAAMRSAVGEPGLRDHFRSAYDAIAAGRVHTHAFANARFARGGGRRPVLVFSHGFGALSRAYTAQLEDLASHGYVIAAIAHTYETLASVFPDGRVAVFAPEPWKANSGSEQASIAYGDVRGRVWAEDIRFVLDQLRREDGEPASRLPFAGRLDLGRTGAFGHSSGGRAAALVCGAPARVQACLNQDGLAMNQPYDRGAAARLEKPFLLFTRPRPSGLPPDEEIARMGFTRESLQALVRKIEADQDAALDAAGPGSYRVTLSMPGASHASFGDEAVIGARDPAGREQAIRNLATIRTYTRAFFDRHLEGRRDTVLDRPGADPTVKVEPFPRRPPRP
jgi:predicted dienelactone hydrolase